MRQTNAGQPRLLGGQCLVVFQFASQLQITFGGDDGIEDLSAGTGTDSRFVEGSLGWTHDADGLAAGGGLDISDSLLH